jgi:hypothetical protein
MNISELKLNPKNPRVIKDEKFRQLCQSIEQFPEMMEKRPMVCVTDPVDGKLFPLGGNMRLKALQHLKMKDVPDAWVSLADDWTQEKRLEFTIKDNVSFGEWDFDELSADWDTDMLAEWGVELPEGKNMNVMDLFDIDIPFYTPSDIVPNVDELADLNKVITLTDRIETMDIDAYLKSILMARAAFFSDFRFDKIADYYFYQPEDVKELFRDLGLVILSPKDAIDRGFVEISENVMEL